PQSGITLAQGSAGAPSLSFSGSPDTGVFSSGAGTLDVATGGTTRLTIRSDGDVDLPGSIRKGEALFLHNRGAQNNLGVGLSAMPGNGGTDNTAVGFGALFHNFTGNRNTATGSLALLNNTPGNDNTATGYEALFSNDSGNFNTATGSLALYSNSSG